MPKPAPDAPREEHRAYANANGYFWLPCPRCGRWWGGHEPHGDGVLLGPTGGLSACCPDDGKPSDPLRIAYSLGARDGYMGKTPLDSSVDALRKP